MDSSRKGEIALFGESSAKEFYFQGTVMFMKAFLKVFSIFGITLILVVGIGVHFSISDSVAPPWQMFRHDLRHTGVSPFKEHRQTNLNGNLE